MSTVEQLYLSEAVRSSLDPSGDFNKIPWDRISQLWTTKFGTNSSSSSSSISPDTCKQKFLDFMKNASSFFPPTRSFVESIGLFSASLKQQRIQELENDLLKANQRKAALESNISSLNRTPTSDISVKMEYPQVKMEPIIKDEFSPYSFSSTAPLSSSSSLMVDEKPAYMFQYDSMMSSSQHMPPYHPASAPSPFAPQMPPPQTPTPARTPIQQPPPPQIIHRTPEQERALLSSLMDRLWAHHDSEIFRYPVSETIAPGYFSIIKNPMDLTTLRKKMEAGEVTMAEQFYRQCSQIWINCFTYNPPETIFFQQAVNMDKFCCDLLQKNFEDKKDQFKPQAKYYKGKLPKNTTEKKKKKKRKNDSDDDDDDDDEDDDDYPRKKSDKRGRPSTRK